ncbi:MAG TPA: pentapeptide repeat-containing protein [Candidatus Binatia bacterium]
MFWLQSIQSQTRLLRQGPHRIVGALVGAFLLTAASQSAAGIAPTSTCSAGKAKATADALRCVVKRNNGSMQYGTTLDLSTCESKLISTFQLAESVGPCSLVGDASAAWAAVVSSEDAILSLLGAATATTADQVKCVIGRNGIAARVVGCDNKIARGLVLHDSIKPKTNWFGCYEKFAPSFDAALDGSSCPGSNEVWLSINEVARTIAMYLRGADLSGQDLSTTNLLPGADLTGADLHGSSLWLSDVSAAVFAGANLEGTYCPYADFQNADLHDADVVGADFRQAKVTGANLSGIDLAAVTNVTALQTGIVSGCPATLPTSWACGGNALTGPGVNLSDLDLDGSDLHGRVLTDAQVLQTTFQGADLSNADLTDLFFYYSDLTGANLTGATFTGVYFDFAILTGAHLSGAIDAGFQGVDLSSFDLSAVDLSGAILSQQDNGLGVMACPIGLPADWTCRGGNLYGPRVDLYDGDLSGADLHNLHLSQAGLARTIMTGADLSGTDLSSAFLEDAVMTGANLTSVDLQSATLTGTVLDSVQWNNTTCPDGTNSTVDGGSCCGHLAGQLPASCSP